MPLLNEHVKNHLIKEFNELKERVKLIVFTQEFECEYCEETRKLIEELASLSDKLSIEVYDFVKDKEKVKKYNIDKIPAIVIEGKKDYGIRFYGIPAGYEFSSLIEAIKMVSTGDSGLSNLSKQLLKKLNKPTRIQVFVTLTCPYCPLAVQLANKIAFESDFASSEMIDSVEFPHLAHKYNVLAVPKIIINEEIQFEGALPEDAFINQVLKTLEKGKSTIYG
ncbi:MAG: thioredoxin family protein [Candidatus Bathyarchaeia archaeon]